MNTAAVSVISASRLPTPGANRIRNTSEFFRKLSLNAEKNWHQNSGANRRVMRRDEDMVISAPVEGLVRAKAILCEFRSLQDDKFGERTIDLALQPASTGRCIVDLPHV